MNEKNQFRVFLVFLFLFAALTLSTVTFAAMALVPIVSGYSASSGGYRSPAGSFTAAANGSSYGSTGTVTVSGKPITVPSNMRMASNAGNFVKNAMRLNPWALVGTLAAGYLFEQGMSHDGDKWNKVGTVGDSTLNPGKTWKQPIGAAPCYQTGDWCTYSQASAGFYGYFTAANGYSNPQFAAPVLLSSGNIMIAVSQSGITNEHVLTVTGTSTATHPATQEDWDALPNPLPALAPELPFAPYMPDGVPVDKPDYNFSPFSTPIGEPYTKPDGSTAQPMAKVSPNGDGITIDTYDQPKTDSNGQPVPTAAPQDTPEPAPESKTDCDKYPSSLGCSNLDTPAPESLTTQQRTIALINPESIGSSGSCPAPLSASFLGQRVEFSFDPLCTYANALRPLVIALAWLAAGFMFMGGVKNG